MEFCMVLQPVGVLKLKPNLDHMINTQGIEPHLSDLICFYLTFFCVWVPVKRFFQILYEKNV